MAISEIDVDELEALDPASIQLIDVREPDEYAEARVPGAVLIPLMSVPDELQQIDSSRPVYLVCKSGGRSMNAALFLDEQGYEAVNVAGGTVDWLARGKPFDSGATGS